MTARLKKSQSDIIRENLPEAIRLSMSPEELKDVEKSRIQNRTIKSARLGELSIDYETGTTGGGLKTVPKELKLVAAPGMTFAYDTILFITVLRYVRLMQREEIRIKILRDHFFHISTGSISELSLMGLAYLEQCHFAEAKKLAERYGKGCFIIHLDGTNEGGRYTHFIVREGVRGNVLYAEKIVSESEDHIKPVLEKVKKYFGVPDAVVSDMSPPIGKAVEAVFRGVPHRLCHYHFLKAIGKSLLSGKHDPLMISVKRMKEMLNAQRQELQTQLDSLRKRKSHEDCRWLISLIDYINDYQKDLNGEGFPFDLPGLAFYNRCETAFNMMENIFHGRTRNIAGEISITMLFIRNRIQEFFGYSHISQLKNLNAIFTELRDILHPQAETEKEKIPLNWGMLDSDIQVVDVTKKLAILRQRAEKKVKTKISPYLMKAWKTVKNRLIKYQDKLDPVIEFNGGKFILPRTNNLCETGFRDCKRKARRTTGIKRLSAHMDNLPPQYFYTFNLNDREYIKTVYGDGEIYDSFHKIDKEEVKKTVDRMKTQRLSPKVIDLKLIRSDDFLKRLLDHFTAKPSAEKRRRGQNAA